MRLFDCISMCSEATKNGLQEIEIDIIDYLELLEDLSAKSESMREHLKKRENVSNFHVTFSGIEVVPKQIGG